MGGNDLPGRLEALHPDAFGWALACCEGDAEAAREALQMAYVRILDGRARFGGRSSFKTWLFGVIRRTSSEQRRQRRLALFRLARAADRAVGSAAPDPEASATASETVRLLRAAIQKLSRRQREMMHLVFYQGMTVDEAAGVLGLSSGTARRHYARGKERLRGLLPEGVRP